MQIKVSGRSLIRFPAPPDPLQHIHRIRLSGTDQQTGLINPRTQKKLWTRVWGYGNKTVSWPGQTIQVVSSSAGGAEETIVRWRNELQSRQHLLPRDPNLHWCYSLHGEHSANGVDYRNFSIKENGVPISTHLHGGNSDFQFDGNPEFFYSPFGKRHREWTARKFGRSITSPPTHTQSTCIWSISRSWIGRSSSIRSPARNQFRSTTA
ncbi:hypothetical protein FQZ97_996690 [compost metagenome]